MIICFVYGYGMKRDGDGDGLRAVGDHIRKSLPDSLVFFQQWDDDVLDTVSRLRNAGQDVVLIGYSFGGSRVVRTANYLGQKGIPVKHMILIDPVPTRGFAGLFNKKDFVVSDNVLKSTCFYRTCLIPPYSKKIRKAKHPSENIKLNLFHTKFPEDVRVHNFIFKSLGVTKP